MRIFLFFVFSAGIIQSITLPATIDYTKMEERIPEGISISVPHYPSMPMANIIPVDSSSGQFSMWTQIHECLAYNPVHGYLQFTCRNFSVGGYLDIWQNDKTFGMPWLEISVYIAQQGPARYPNSIASLNGQGPHISMPTLISGSWGRMVAQYERGGWFSSSWDEPVDVGTGDLDVHKCIGKQLPNGNLLFIGVARSDYSSWLT